jgi:hypothetical protein
VIFVIESFAKAAKVAARGQWRPSQATDRHPLGGTAITTWICGDGPLQDHVDIPSQL